MTEKLTILKNKFRDNAGSYYTDFLVGIMIIFVVVALAMTILPVYTQKNLMDGIADDIARYIEIVGQAETEDIADLTSELAAEYGINPDRLTVTVTAERYHNPATGKIQIMDPFKVELTYLTQIGISEYAIVPITLHGRAGGRSEVYWK